ncbi:MULTISPECIES: glycoside hydrolase family 3 protein [Yersinia]|uniref:glycoside hydrolase family 3 protein n=1 Tax=Yersinia TaxID=629 RepID=UPI0005E90B4C|nr:MULTISPECIES: glycoside hydrolase family 3 protein [Yersinia]OVZ99409.1 glycosyl hydrolase [Yersinia frederiksenii]RXA97135.1 glycoside hydrolase family 3 protein [Yersinia sp. 2105 StPb PI]CNI48707.1 glycosyl hydrolase family protein [Yersinia frederiksenii]CNK99581.1 glycosyl hydrolase family protein [Yersinia frederiksenii]
MKKIIPAILLFSTCTNAGVIPDSQLKEMWLSPKISAEKVISKMNFDEKLGQILMVDIRSWSNDNSSDKKPFTEINDTVSQIIHDYHLGSIILFRENLIDTPQTVELINNLQRARSNLPLFISTDQEGGYVTRLRVGTEMPGNMALGATRSAKLAQQAGSVHGYELSSLGFNFNFGPVVDVNNNQNNPVIGVRSYSDDPVLVGELARSYIQGIHKSNVLTSLKHFPGHGNVSSDTHFALPTVNIDKAAWQQIELKPFVDVMPVTDAIMTAHIVVPALDNTQLTNIKGEKIGTPATLSKPILTDILRNQLKYNGLILTDAMDMGAITNNFDRNWSIKQAIMAGNDIVLMPMEIKNSASVEQLNALYGYLKAESAKDPALKQRIDDAAQRVIYTKLNKRISPDPHDTAIAEKIVASENHKNIENFISEQAITLIKNDNVLPYHLKPQNGIMVFSDEKPRNELITKHLHDIANQFHVTFDVKSQVIKLDKDDISSEDIANQIKGQNFIILATYNLKLNPVNAQRIIDAANKENIPLVVISSRNPYDIAYLSGVKANIAIYGITGFDVTNNVRNSLETNIRSGLRTLFQGPKGKLDVLAEPRGKLPVDIRTPDNSQILYPRGYGLTML